jgi:hypothetical protein
MTALLAVLGLCLLTPLGAGAQQRPVPPRLADSSAKAIVAHMRGNVRGLEPFLRQTAGAQPRGKLDEIADSLVRIGSRDDSPAATSAVWTLASAGSRDSSSRKGVRYDGALDRLIRIHAEAPRQSQVRGAALEAMLEVEGRGRAIDYLFRVATSTDPSAGSAMRALTFDTDPQTTMSKATPAERSATLVRLRALWEKADAEPRTALNTGQPSVPDLRAWAFLSSLASQKGWVR